MNLVTCATKLGNNYNPYERITHIGGRSEKGNFKITSDEAIRMIDSGQYTFHVNVNNMHVKVITAERNGRKYLKTATDGYEPNNLLALGDCL